jgi:hypothetical protein
MLPQTGRDYFRLHVSFPIGSICMGRLPVPVWKAAI